MASRLEAAVNVATLVACVAVVTTIGIQLHARYKGDAEQRPGKPQFIKVGERLVVDDTLNHKGAQQTLVMLLASKCKYCAESMPFYRRLVDKVKSSSSQPIQLVAVTPDSLDVATNYLKVNGLESVTLAAPSPAQRARLRVPGTPTLILLDQAGVVKRIWFGQLGAEREAALLAAVFP